LVKFHGGESLENRYCLEERIALVGVDLFGGGAIPFASIFLHENFAVRARPGLSCGFKNGPSDSAARKKKQHVSFETLFFISVG
jgi:hypothetical protein